MNARGFTLTEMLVVLAMVVMLAAILFPAIESGKEHARRAVCASNQREIAIASLAMSNETAARIYIPTRSSAEDSVGYLYPSYLSDARAAICPSTENRIRMDVMSSVSMSWYGRMIPQDLTVAASDARDESGLSFEIFTWNDGPAIFPDGQEWNGQLRGTLNDQRGVGPGELSYDPAAGKTGLTLKNRRIVKTPSTDLILLDSDQGGSATSANVNNWPDPMNNHMEFGLNIAFCDGHVRWIPAEPTLIETYMAAHMNPATNWYLKHPTLKATSVSLNGYTYTKYTY